MSDLSLKILVIDDEQVSLEYLGDLLCKHQHQVITAHDGAEGLAVLQRDPVDVVITDLRMPGMDGFAVLAQAKRLVPGTEVIVVTGSGDIESAVRAMREGAFDFFAKPVKVADLMVALERLTRYHTLRQERDRFQERLDLQTQESTQHYSLAEIIGESQPMQWIKDRIRRVSIAGETTALVVGETGTGKELVARAIHYGSPRAAGPFVAVDCTALPENLIENELFGHVKGAFTDAKEARKGYFELAHGGTLFLDEIGDMPLSMQVKLLRSLEQRSIRRVGGSQDVPVDVRVVSATNRDLLQAVHEGKFREDLYYRLNTVTIPLPPLRDRRDDILPLAHHFLRHYTRELRKPVAGFAPEAGVLLGNHPFPGNVRELRNIVERAVILCTGEQLLPGDLGLDNARQTSTPSARYPTNGAPATLDLETLEKWAVEEAFRNAQGNQVQAAKLLGISRSALQRRLQRL